MPGVAEPPAAPRAYDRTRGRPVYLALAPDPVLAFWHPASPVSASGTAALLCPPFGWEDTSSYRSRRAWADALAAAGHASARIDFPGAGDSGGSPRDPERVEAWTSAVAEAARWLLAESGCSRLVAIGIGLGGMVACRAQASGAPIDDLVLWAVPAKGKRIVRELRAFARVAATEFPDPRAVTPPSAPDGFLNVSGFLLSDETINGLEAIDLTALDVPRGSECRVLLLGRDGQPVDAALQKHFAQSGAEVTVDDGSGYAALMAGAQRAEAPRAVFARTISWLADAPQAAVHSRSDGGSALDGASAELRVKGGAVRERALRFELRSGSAFGVLTEPVGTDRAPVCMVLLNAGAVRRVGPNRMWVEAARRWATTHGIQAVRVDIEGLGDADGDEHMYEHDTGFYIPELTDEVLAILDQLAAEGIADRFVLAGLCSGAYWSYRAALRDERVVGALMINLWAFHWSEELVVERKARRTLALVRSGGLSWLRVLSAGRIWRVVRTIPGRIRLSARPAGFYSGADDVVPSLDQLRDRGTQALVLLSRDEPLYDDFLRSGQLDQLGRWPNFQLESIPSRDHTFREIWLQEHVHASLDSALQRVLQAADDPARPSGA